MPPAYRAYLAEHDGGRLDDNDDAVKMVFGVGDVPEWASIWEALDTYSGRVPDWLLPVADDEYGNLFCISLRDTDRGSVWFWDHEQEAGDGLPPTDDNIQFRTGSWPSFLASLRPIET